MSERYRSKDTVKQGMIKKLKCVHCIGNSIQCTVLFYLFSSL